MAILQKYGGPKGLKKIGRSRVRRWVRSQKGFGEAALHKVDEMFDAVQSQSVELPGAEDIEYLIRMETSSLSAALRSRGVVAEKRDTALGFLPEAAILMSLPGVGAVTCATFIAEVGDASRFPSAAKLAAYAGLSPRVKKSGASGNSVSKPHGGK